MAYGDNKPAVVLPSALSAEQALLGAVIFDNTCFTLLPEGLKPGHFSEPFHQRLFGRLQMHLERGGAIDLPILASGFGSDPAYRDLGGMRYLATLIDHAPPGANAPDYAKEIIATAVRRSLVLMSAGIQERVAGGDHPDMILADIERELGEMHAAGSAVSFTDSDDAMDRVLDYIDNPQNHPAGICTGLQALDEALGPWLPGDLIVMGARPGMGKSACAAIIGRNTARDVRGGVAEIHAEMSVEQAWRRRLTATAYEMFGDRAPPYSAIRKRTITFDQRQVLAAARDQLRGIPLTAVKRTGITLGRLRAIVQHKRAKFERAGIPLTLLTIDHVGLIKSDREYTSRVDQQSEVSAGLKELAGDLKVPILALAQLNRQVEAREDKRPTLSDLRDSGSWEQDADIVIGLYRDAYYAQREKAPPQTNAVAWATLEERRSSKKIEALLLKVREGATGAADLWAHMPTNTILGAPPPFDFGGLV